MRTFTIGRGQGEQDDNFIKFVVVEIPLLPGGVLQMKIVKILPEIAFPLHGTASLLSYKHTAFFAMFQARNTIHVAN